MPVARARGSAAKAKDSAMTSARMAADTGSSATTHASHPAAQQAATRILAAFTVWPSAA